MVLPSEMGSLGASAVPMTTSPPPLEPSQPLAFVDHGGLDVVVTHSSMTIGQVVSVDDQVIEIGELASNSEHLFMKELCDLFACLKVDSHVFVKSIACNCLARSVASLCRCPRLLSE